MSGWQDFGTFTVQSQYVGDTRVYRVIGKLAEGQYTERHLGDVRKENIQSGPLRYVWTTRDGGVMGTCNTVEMGIAFMMLAIAGYLDLIPDKYRATVDELYRLEV